MATETVKLEDQLAAEREYYLRRTETIPGTSKTVADARREYRELVRKEDERMAKRRIEYLGTLPKRVDTTVVTHDVLANIERDPAAITPAHIVGEVDEQGNPPTGYVREDLAKKTKADLVVIAREARSHVVPDSMTKDRIIDIILGENEDERDES